MGEAHAAQDVGRLGELYVVIADDLYAVAPGVEKVEKRSRQRCDAGFQQGLSRRLLVIDHQSEMPPVVRRLRAPLLQREELVTQVDESHRIALAAQFEIEQAAVKSQS